jgi:hypothetical protein
MRRNEKDLPQDMQAPAGIHLDHNPGLMAIWSSLYPSKPFEPQGGGVLFDLPTPHTVEWWTQGRLATRAECDEALKRGLPKLVEVAAIEGPEALRALEAQIDRMLPLLPA